MVESTFSSKVNEKNVERNVDGSLVDFFLDLDFYLFFIFLFIIFFFIKGEWVGCFFLVGGWDLVLTEPIFTSSFCKVRKQRDNSNIACGRN